MELIWTLGRPPKLSYKTGYFSSFGITPLYLGVAPLIEIQKNKLDVIEKYILKALKTNNSKVSLEVMLEVIFSFNEFGILVPWALHGLNGQMHLLCN